MQLGPWAERRTNKIDRTHQRGKRRRTLGRAIQSHPENCLDQREHSQADRVAVAGPVREAAVDAHSHDLRTGPISNPPPPVPTMDARCLVYARLPSTGRELTSAICAASRA